MRRSETFAQQEHEDAILREQFAQATLHDEHESQASSTSAKPEPQGLKGKLKGFWNRTVFPAFPEAIADVKSMRTSMHLDERIKKDIKDVQRFPEIAHVAQVRIGSGLSHEELEFIHARKAHVHSKFAAYMGVPPEEVHPDDIPVIGFGGSGGGYRAMLGMMAYGNGMKKSGLWELLSYTAGVSGSCWALAAFYTFGDASWPKVIEHCKERLSPHHPLSGEAIRSVLNAPGGHYKTLGPLIQKSISELRTVPMDLYAVFTTGHLFMPKAPPPTSLHGQIDRNSRKDPETWSKWSDAIKCLQQGQEPLPILTAIRHERPWRDWVDEEHPFNEPDHGEKEHEEADDAWFQWYELSPFEVGCDETGAHVPTWGFGRPFSEGKSTMQLPEQSLALLLGLCVSAPAGPLTSYIATVQRNLPTGFIGDTIHKLAHGLTKMWGKQGTEEFRQHHPLHACNEHNFMYHLTPVKSGEPRPAGLENSPRIHLIDSGMDNNCPTYVLLHPDRQCDVILNMDASSDVQKDSFQQRVDQIGSRRGIKFTKRDDLRAGPEDDPRRFNHLYAQIYDGVLSARPDTVTDSYGKTVKNPPGAVCKKACTMVYLPLLPNENAVSGFDPSTAKFSGSYNLVWTPEQIDMLTNVCLANFRQGEEKIKIAIKDAWMRKRKMREGFSGAVDE